MMVSSATVATIDSVRQRVHGDARVSLSDFSRGRHWRGKLDAQGFLELQEHGERTAWIVSEEGMANLVDYIAELEVAIERADIAAMLEAREGEGEWRSGAELAKEAHGFFDAHRSELMAVLSDD